MALSSSTSFMNLKDIRNTKHSDESSSGMVCFAQMKPSCILRARSSMQDPSQHFPENSSIEFGSNQQAEKFHGSSRPHSKTESRVPVFVMLPLDTVCSGGRLSKPKAMNASLKALKMAGAEGVMVDAWWGLVEKDGPSQYNWEGYAELVNLVQRNGLKIQVVMSFHQCGGNVGDSCRY